MTAQIMVIEDEVNIRRFVAANLTVRGYSVEEHETAESGLESMRLAPPDVLVLDLILPGMNGTDLLLEMLMDETLLYVPVIVFSASTTDLLLDRARYENVVEILTKPVSVEDLTGAVSRAVGTLNRRP
ncbi:MAG: response regulator [Chloroflexi bacterium]|nr:response regulator [Chloroflexota bacterium]